MGGDFPFKVCGADFMRFDQLPLTWSYILVINEPVFFFASLWDLQMTERMENEIEYDMITNEYSFPKKKF